MPSHFFSVSSDAGDRDSGKAADKSRIQEYLPDCLKQWKGFQEIDLPDFGLRKFPLMEKGKK